MLKKSLSLSLAIATALTVSACSNSNNASNANANASAPAGGAPASGEKIVLRLSHFWPATSTAHKELFEPWAKDIETQSNGRLKIELYPSAGLAKPDVTHEAVVKGTIDIGSQAQGYTNGRFPLSQITELPGMSTSAEQISCTLQTLVENGTIAKEYDDAKVLFMYGTPPGVLHTKTKAINTPADLKGMRIRHPSAVAAGILETLGATPTGMPAGEVYTSLERGVIDGLSLAWEPLRSFRLDEITKSHTNIPYYSSGVMITMNKAKYDSLPADLKKVIDDNSGLAMSKKYGKVFDAKDKIVLDELTKRGDTIVTINDPLNDPTWGPALKQGTDKYLNDLKAKGLDADTVYAKAKEASAACKAS